MLIGYIGPTERAGKLLDVSAAADGAETLRSIGCEKIFSEEEGKQKSRAALKAAVEFLRPDDVLVVTELAQLGQDIESVVLTIDRLRSAGVHLRVGNQSFLAGTPEGDAFLFTCQELAKLVHEPEAMGKLSAMRRRGRPHALSAKDLARARRLLSEEAMTVADVARALGVSAATLYRYFPRRAVESPAR